ncbi:MAG: (2Fe-2S) ferredoxin domain-containing protein [Sandaracinaceae bacterium]|nr:(2Fe-2S) ferredoxin domain-containing protein [Sandaracinaceae bacterium]
MEQPLYFPTRVHLLVCTGPSCTRVGSRELFARVWKRLEDENIAYYSSGGNVRLTETGCLGACSFGPNMTCYYTENGALREAWYSSLDEDSFMNVARALQQGRPAPVEHRYDKR